MPVAAATEESAVKPTTPVQVAHRPIPQDGPKPGINVPDDTHGNGGNLGGKTLRAHVEFEVEGSLTALFLLFRFILFLPISSRVRGNEGHEEVELKLGVGGDASCGRITGYTPGAVPVSTVLSAGCGSSGG